MRRKSNFGHYTRRIMIYTFGQVTPFGSAIAKGWLGGHESVMRILLADDHDLVRDMISAFLQGEGVGPVTTVGDLDGALDALSLYGPFDLVLLDYDMPGMQGLSGLASVMQANGAKPVAMISGSVTADLVVQALEMGAAGFVPKTMGARSLVAAVRLMAAGEKFAPLSLIRREKATGDGLLSPREVDVLKGVSAGKSNKEIARDLDLQEVTVKLHVKTMTRKLGAKNRTHAAMIARDRKLV
jgi:two-component system nitrate/nitrite response regulator NarL